MDRKGTSWWIMLMPLVQLRCPAQNFNNVVTEPICKECTMLMAPSEVLTVENVYAHETLGFQSSNMLT